MRQWPACGAVPACWVRSSKPHPRTTLGHLTQISDRPGQPWWSCQTSGWLHASAWMGLWVCSPRDLSRLGFKPGHPSFSCAVSAPYASKRPPRRDRLEEGKEGRDGVRQRLPEGMRLTCWRGWVALGKEKGGHQRMANTGSNPSIRRRRILAQRGSFQDWEGCSVGASPRAAGQGCPRWCVCLGRVLVRGRGSPAGKQGPDFPGLEVNHAQMLNMWRLSEMRPP